MSYGIVFYVIVFYDIVSYVIVFYVIVFYVIVSYIIVVYDIFFYVIFYVVVFSFKVGVKLKLLRPEEMTKFHRIVCQILLKKRQQQRPRLHAG